MSRLALLSGATACCLMISATNAATITPSPTYTENFNDNLAQDFVEANESNENGEFTAANTVYELRDTSRQSANRLATATVDVSNIGGSQTNDFSVSASFKLNSTSGFSNGQIDFGFNILTDYLLEVDLMTNGATDGFLKIAGSSVSDTSDTALTLTNGSTYTMLAEGTYSLGTLTLDFTVTEVGNALNSVSAQVVDATPATGQSVGFRWENQRSSGSLDIDDFAITVVPEPTSLSALGLAALALGRRRKHAN
jgi:hypothetical protein